MITIVPLKIRKVLIMQRQRSEESRLCSVSLLSASLELTRGFFVLVVVAVLQKARNWLYISPINLSRTLNLKVPETFEQKQPDVKMQHGGPTSRPTVSFCCVPSFSFFPPNSAFSHSLTS